jgi:hypothetical protein
LGGPPHLIFSSARREKDQGEKNDKERVEVRGHSSVKGTRIQGEIKGSRRKPQGKKNPPLFPL